jgi:hypothetical protein
MTTLIQAEDSQTNWGALLKCLERTKKELDVLVKVVRDLTESAPLDAYASLVRNRDITRSLVSGCSEIQSHLANVDVYTIVSSLADSKRIRYQDLLEAALRSHQLSHTGRWPAYVIADIARLDIRLEKFEATIDGKKCASIEPEAIAQLLADRVSSLWRTDFDPMLFRSHLLSAFEDLRKQSSAPGGYVDIRDLFLAVKAKYDTDKRAYLEAHFGVDLFRLSVHEQTSTSGASLELSPAQDARGGLFVPGRDGGNYIAALRFR